MSLHSLRGNQVATQFSCAAVATRKEAFLVVRASGKEVEFQMRGCHQSWGACFSDVSPCLSILIKIHGKSHFLVLWSRRESLNFVAAIETDSHNFYTCIHPEEWALTL